jgi:hypothetical protein
MGAEEEEDFAGAANVYIGVHHDDLFGENVLWVHFCR